ncbi:MAG TPA: lipoyl(octanoyl) transferase LipB [Gammaproteobacteria bacterium]|nr:lipoyl(octanoyl) transferase LipB [Gammaproteobacteria bacterium]
MNGLKPAVIRDLGRRPMPDVWAQMQSFTMGRTADTADEIWFVEHPPVFTLGMRADRSHLLAPGDIPVVQIDRGGQVTYHGPGQLVVYVLLDLQRLELNVRSLVQTLELAVIETVAAYGVTAKGRRDAPGVYVDGKKLAAIGLRVRRNCSYHGLAVNVSMDLTPFKRIHPCGFEDLEVTQLAEVCDVDDPARFRADFEPRLLARLYG